VEVPDSRAGSLQPDYLGDRLFVTTAVNQTKTGRSRWAFTESRNRQRTNEVLETPLIYGDYLYSCQTDGVLSCYRAATGEQIYKERMGTGGDGFTASPVALLGRLYFASERGTVFVVKPGADFTVLATNQMNEVSMATPAISEGTIFFRTQGRVVAVGSRE
jgi:outer membrane protein assembly factor BamB